ncbi:unnamed protein product [Allacma fusca]|uniref:C2H2-type domain-containing protein n=1 Tax=Allacma fusca TaxID=39272 RepID=A0A8J2PT12_9HEXA|nr:unnamed protein product [Allacma fusca]
MSKCFACGALLEPDLELSVKFLDLWKILRLSSKINLVLVEDELGKFCGDCCGMIRAADEICRQLEELDGKLEKVQERLRVTISSNYVECPDIATLEDLIKKSLIECWQVPESKDFSSGRLSNERTGEGTDGIIIEEDPFRMEDCLEDGNVEDMTVNDSVGERNGSDEDIEDFRVEGSIEGIDKGLTEEIDEDHADEIYNGSAEEVGEGTSKRRNSRRRSPRRCKKFGISEESVSSEVITDDEGHTGHSPRAPKRRKISSETDIEVAENSVDNKDEVRCDECNKRFKDGQSLAIHIKRVHEGDMKPYECLVCKWKFASPSKLQSHAQSRHHSQIPEAPPSTELRDCPECSQQFKDTTLLEAHIKNKHQGVDRPFECTICLKTYKKRSHLHDHQRVAHGSNRPFYCEWCNPAEKVSFSTQKKLDMHILTKHQNNTCNICEKNFKTPYILNRHMNSHSNISSAVFICEICGAKYRALKRLKVHQMRHDNKEPFSCDQCGRVFSEPRTLQHHRDSVHENKFKYHCEICGIGCQQIYMLNRHMMCHSSEKKFTCEVCGLKFKRKQQLIIHERKHTGERPFKCRQCGKEFTEKKKLKNHEFVHGGEKPYQCSICSKQFALRHYLTHHINSYHKNPKRNSKVRIVEEDLQLQQEITLDGGLILDQLDPKFVSVELIDEPQVVHEEVIAYDESSAQLEGGLVVGEWIQFGFVSND